MAGGIIGRAQPGDLRVDTKTHDVVIVGAGTAGCVLAERLTASGRLRVLLVEAGGNPSSPFVGIPAGFARLFRGPLDWAFETEPQRELGGRRVFMPRGRMLGGCSNMNAQIHHWCHPADFDGWAALGATGWEWGQVAPVLRSMERCAGGGAGRGEDGPMVVAPNANVNAMAAAFVNAVRACGPGGHEDDYNGRGGEGAWISQLAQRKGRRFGTYHAYLEPAMRRPNLEVLAGAHVTRVLVERGRASGVQLRRDGAPLECRARLGVVLAAGAFGSPQLLLLSGLGPAAELGRMGIEVVRDSPGVGRELQDHPMVPIVFGTARRDTLKNAESPGSLLRYLLFKRGMLASNIAEAIALIRAGADTHAPDLELLFAPVEWRQEGLERPKVHAFTIGVIAIAPRSRGRVSLADPDPMRAPAIDPGYLTDADGADASVLLSGIRLARRVASTQPLAPDRASEIDPGEEFTEDAQLLAWTRGKVQSLYHPAGTCRMGSDPGAVVDPRLGFRGIEALWVADASVMPTVPRGHPNAVVAMIAQRAAGWIEASA